MQLGLPGVCSAYSWQARSVQVIAPLLRRQQMLQSSLQQLLAAEAGGAASSAATPVQITAENTTTAAHLICFFMIHLLGVGLRRREGSARRSVKPNLDFITWTLYVLDSNPTTDEPLAQAPLRHVKRTDDDQQQVGPFRHRLPPQSAFVEQSGVNEQLQRQ